MAIHFSHNAIDEKDLASERQCEFGEADEKFAWGNVTGLLALDLDLLEQVCFWPVTGT